MLPSIGHPPGTRDEAANGGLAHRAAMRDLATAASGGVVNENGSGFCGSRSSDLQKNLS
jgi:hypothetical protein